jgi:hypothetical protein
MRQNLTFCTVDILDPILGTIAGIGRAGFSLIIFFSLKVLLFCLPFVAVGFILERDVYRVAVIGKVIKVSILLAFVLPVLLFAVFNYVAPGLHESFWENYQILEFLWIMKGPLAPVVLAGLCIFYVSVYAAAIVRGDLRD